MRGFFPIHFAQGQNDRQEQTTAKTDRDNSRSPVGMTSQKGNNNNNNGNGNGNGRKN
jgi:hypothetical protein